MKSKTIDTLAAQTTPEQVQIEIKANKRLVGMGMVLLMAGVAVQVIFKLMFLTFLGVIVLGVGIYNHDLYKMVAKRQDETKKPA